MGREIDHGKVRIGSIVVRCYEYDRMVAFWQAALHHEVEHADPNGGFVILRDPQGTGPNVSKSIRQLTGEPVGEAGCTSISTRDTSAKRWNGS
jgi:hypothetical protein